MRMSRRVIVWTVLVTGAAVACAPGASAGPRAPGPAAPVAPTAADVVARVQSFYRGVGQAQARFTQVVTNTTFGRTDTAGGTVWLKPPGKMRWRYDGKPRRGKVTAAKDFVSDGATFYLVDHENQQLVVKQLGDSALPAAVAFLQGQGDLAADFTAALEARAGQGSPGSVVVRLTPKAPTAQLATLHLIVDPSDYHVEETLVTDGAGNTSRFRFERLDTSTAIADRMFRVDPRHRALRAYRVVP